MILYFMRHGKAGHGTAAPDDDERVLTPAGVDALRAAAPAWQRLDMRPDAVISSPLPRALQTAELLVAGLQLPDPPLVDDGLRPGAQWTNLARAMESRPKAQRVMFVGHEPDLSNAIGLLTGAAVRMRKGAVACVEFAGGAEAGGGELAWLLDPDLYTSAEPERVQVTRTAGYALCQDAEGRILLARLSADELKPGYWTLPGGGIEFGEAPIEAALRELSEETGLTGEVVSLAGVESWVRHGPMPGGTGDDFQAIQIMYRVRVTGGTLRDEVGGSTDAAAWFTLGEVSSLPVVELVKAGIRLLEPG